MSLALILASATAATASEMNMVRFRPATSLKDGGVFYGGGGDEMGLGGLFSVVVSWGWGW